MNHREICKRYIRHNLDNTGKDHARGHNVYFERSTLYSYGSHFPMAWCITTPSGKDFFLVNADRYSVSTCKHQGHLWSAMYQAGLTGAFEGVAWAYIDGLKGKKSAAEITDEPFEGLIRNCIAHYETVAEHAAKKAIKARKLGDHWHGVECEARTVIYNLRNTLSTELGTLN